MERQIDIINRRFMNEASIAALEAFANDQDPATSSVVVFDASGNELHVAFDANDLIDQDLGMFHFSVNGGATAEYIDYEGGCVFDQSAEANLAVAHDFGHEGLAAVQAALDVYLRRNGVRYVFVEEFISGRDKIELGLTLSAKPGIGSQIDIELPEGGPAGCATNPASPDHAHRAFDYALRYPLDLVRLEAIDWLNNRKRKAA